MPGTEEHPKYFFRIQGITEGDSKIQIKYDGNIRSDRKEYFANLSFKANTNLIQRDMPIITIDESSIFWDHHDSSISYMIELKNHLGESLKNNPATDQELLIYHFMRAVIIRLLLLQKVMVLLIMIQTH